MKNDNANIKSKHKLGASGTVVLMMLATVVAKGLGLLRSVLMAKYYGAGMLSNAFSEASHIPLTFFDLLFATAISGCFIPVYNSFKRREDGGISEEADEFACSFFNLVLLGAGILAFLGIVFADVIVGTLGLDNETKALTVRLMRIMFPMIISVDEVRVIKRIVNEVKSELDEQEIPYGTVELGIMIETPAAVMISDLLAKEVDFFSIGTNDLTQYTLAIDRQNPKLDDFYNSHHEAVLRMIRMVVENGHKEGCWVGICGELGADTSLTETFVSMGIDELSVSPSMVLKVREAVRNIED